MSADFWAGYLSGAIGIVIGNPLDVLKVRLQGRAAQHPASPTATSYLGQFPTTASLVAGTAAPVLGYGALNALLFVSYNRSVLALDSLVAAERTTTSLWTTWLAGAVGGLATWVVSTPTELIKCRAQVASPSPSSAAIARRIWRTEGLRGLYFGGAVTALRDSIGYGFYFWSYELMTRSLAEEVDGAEPAEKEAVKVLLCGGLAGIVTWASIFPLDVVKTRLQTQQLPPDPGSDEASPLVRRDTRRKGTWQVTLETYRDGGVRAFFRGLTLCSVRAFVVNAVQWSVYEWVMGELGSKDR